MKLHDIIFKHRPYSIIAEYSGVLNFSDGHKEWYLRGKLYGLDRPACEYSIDYNEWYIFGNSINNTDDFLELCILT